MSHVGKLPLLEEFPARLLEITSHLKRSPRNNKKNCECWLGCCGRCSLQSGVFVCWDVDFPVWNPINNIIKLPNHLKCYSHLPGYTLKYHVIIFPLSLVNLLDFFEIRTHPSPATPSQWPIAGGISKSPHDRVVGPLPNGRFMAYIMGVTIITYELKSIYIYIHIHTCFL